MGVVQLWRETTRARDFSSYLRTKERCMERGNLLVLCTMSMFYFPNSKYQNHNNTQINTSISTHFIFSPFSQIPFPFSTQKTPADWARQWEPREWEKCVELLEVRGEGGHVCVWWLGFDCVLCWCCSPHTPLPLLPISCCSSTFPI